MQYPDRRKETVGEAREHAANFVRFRNGPLFVKSSEWYLAAGFVLPFVVDSAAAT